MTPSALIRIAIAAGLSVALRAAAQTPTSAGPETTATVAATSVVQADSQMSVPFNVGETAEYDVKFGALKVGSASTLVKGVE
ncbi:MAG TPA: hypothetical protein VLI40_08615, partial [Gemmatimonadaceae bacterium]|nr:hypothetical protein [Gemmatimonadaceae bacterium]